MKDKGDGTENKTGGDDKEDLRTTVDNGSQQNHRTVDQTVARQGASGGADGGEKNPGVPTLTSDQIGGITFVTSSINELATHVDDAPVRSLMALGRGLSAVGAGVESYQLFDAVEVGDLGAAIDAGIDLGMAIGPSIFGGPVGVALGIGYAAADNLVGFDNVGGVVADGMCAISGKC